MSDHDGVEPVPETSSHQVSRRGVLRAGLVALTAAQLPDGLVSRALAQGAKPGANLIGKLEGADGAPFTADDCVFWFEDVYSNKEIVPTPLSVMSINGKPIAVKKVDASTVQFVAPDPYYALPTVLASVWGIGHHARFGRDALGGFAPAHYLKQFHPKYASNDDLAN